MTENSMSIPTYLVALFALYGAYFISNLIYDLYFKLKGRASNESSSLYSTYEIEQEKPEQVLVEEQSLPVERSYVWEEGEEISNDLQNQRSCTQTDLSLSAGSEDQPALLLHESENEEEYNSTPETHGKEDSALEKLSFEEQEFDEKSSHHLGEKAPISNVLSGESNYMKAEPQSSVVFRPPVKEASNQKSEISEENRANAQKTLASSPRTQKGSISTTKKPVVSKERAKMENLFLESSLNEPAPKDVLEEKKLKWKKLLELSQTSVEIQNKDGQITYRSLLNAKEG
ncbi:hypothetical protein [Planobacterium oryzisoli]|uniref:Uncharacterized protein n=1 Tax=Planobacterium oryzisoli TaxID=2771435 RepID=A0A930YV54_9FLAO|nr:hypothetical protein [Planobacterium oryzisoli]MBF5026944.1 hypothetical protein [Planobacterium oryzisoli]